MARGRETKRERVGSAVRERERETNLHRTLQHPIEDTHTHTHTHKHTHTHTVSPFLEREKERERERNG